MVRGHGFSSPSSPATADAPTRRAEAPGDVPGREGGELRGRIGAVLQVLADALVELPLQSQDAGHRVERPELVLLQRPDRVEGERPPSRREEVAVQQAQDEPPFGADVGCKPPKEDAVDSGGYYAQPLPRAVDRIASRHRQQLR